MNADAQRGIRDGGGVPPTRKAVSHDAPLAPEPPSDVPASASGDTAATIRVEGFEILEKIGSGGMATVWKARQTSLDRIVAIKVLRPEFAADPGEVRLFLEEARAVARLRHSNIVQVHDTGSRGGLHYFVMEYLPGRTLGRILREQGAVSVKTALRVVRQVAGAMDYAWEKAGIVHHDVKPDNIIIDDEGAAKITDLGLAMVMREHRTSGSASGAIAGTPNYMAPEQVNGEKTDCRTDIYSLGATLYHMVTGRMPFDGRPAAEAMRAQVEGTLPHPRDLNPRLPIGIAQLLTRMLMKEPADRPANWSEALHDIGRVAAGRALLQKTAGKSTLAAASTPPPPQAGSESRVPPPAPYRRATLVRAAFLAAVWTICAILLLWPLLRHLRGLPRHAAAVPADAGSGLPAMGDDPFDGNMLSGRPDIRPSSPRIEPPPVDHDAERERRLREHGEVDLQKLRLVARNVVFFITRGRLDEAAGEVDQALQEPRWRPIGSELEEIGGFVRAAAEIETRVIEGFRNRIRSASVLDERMLHFYRNQIRESDSIDERLIERFQAAGLTVAMNVGNRAMDLIVSGVTDQSVVLLHPEASGRSVIVGVDRLSPRERLRWIGAPEDAATALIHVLLLLEAGDTEAAAAMALRCGLLADALNAHIRSL